jgi:NitT/TauT family transport system permease protein
VAVLDAELPQIAQPNRTIETVKAVIPPIAIFVTVLVFWQVKVIHTILNIQIYQLPLPSQIVEAFGNRSEDLWTGTWYTVGEAVAGLVLGAGLGFLAALLFVQWGGLRRGLMPIAVSANAIPIIAITPIVARWLGFDQPTRIVVVAIMTFAPMVVSAYKGLTSLNNESLDLMHSYAATSMDIFLKLRLPSSLPYVFSALRVGATACIIGSVVAEFFDSAGGIGKLIANNIQSGDFALAWCGVVIVTLVGLVLYGIVGILERFLVSWEARLR